MTIMLKNYNADNIKLERQDQDDKEHSIKLPRASYEALSSRKLEISSLVSANIIWDNDNSEIVLLGSEESVHQTACVLSQYLSPSSGSSRRLVGRSLHTINSLNSLNTGCHTDSLDEAKNLLLMSHLPPELSISSHHYAAQQGGGGRGFSQFSGLQHSPLGRTVSDSHTKIRNSSETSGSSLTRRKLESEDSSYDSDHECLAGTMSVSLEPLSLSSSQMSKSHDDVTRTYSETLGQEFAEYVSIGQSIKPDATFPKNNANHHLLEKTHGEKLTPRSNGGSREASPVHRIHEGSDPIDVEFLDKDQYIQKVEFALKLGYAEELTRTALKKVGLSACNDDLLNELIRLGQKEAKLKESCGDLVQATLISSTESSLNIRTGAGDSNVSLNSNLRPIVIDGSNVAMSHGNKGEIFSCRGIKICVDWFRTRGHTDIKVFLPSWRKEASKPDTPITSQNVLKDLEKEKVLFYTPSRQVGGRRIVTHDDRYILNLASETDAIVVSNDHFRELMIEKKEFKKVIEERILPYVWVEDRFMPPDDPMGKNGPPLDKFLKMPSTFSSGSGSSISPNIAQPCPYGKKCTYGNKCKFFHAERGNVPMKTVTDKLKEQSKRQILEVRTRNTSRDSSPGELIRAKSMNLRRTESDGTAFGRKPQQNQVSRTMSSRPLAYPDYIQQPPQHPLHSEVSKSKSVEASGRGYQARDLRMSSVPIQSDLDMGCLSSYGLQQPPPASPWSSHVYHQPPPHPPAQHRKLERQLTINPSYDPRINKSDKISSTSHNQQPILTSEAIEYMHRNPPPPFGLVNISEQSELSHQNVTRNASAPDSIKHWSRETGSSVAISGPSQTISQNEQSVGLDVGAGATASADQSSSMHRLNSGSDTQLNRVMSTVNRAYSADPFTSSDTWNFTQFDTSMSPLLGTSIWSAAPEPVPQTPPTSPVRNLGPVGSRPVANLQQTQQYQHLCNIFPTEQVEHVMKLFPREKDTKVLCKKITELFP